MDVKKIKTLAARIRLETLKVIRSRGFGHVGGSMDLADLMAVLYGEVMHFDPQNPRWEDRDWLVMSKGHAGPVVYATLGLMGYYPLEEAYTLNHPGTRFPSHTDRLLTPGVDLTTGSLGQGVSTATGAALANRIDGRDNRVFCVIGDGEADEGQVWEALHFAYAHKLDNIIYFFDNNGYQLDGPTAVILDHGSLAKKAEGDSLGGEIECAVYGIPAGVGSDFFGGLEALIARTVFSIPAVKGLEFGKGFEFAKMSASEANDGFCVKDGNVRTVTNNCGGILGGISSGMPLTFSVAFKPTPSISIPQRSVNLDTMEDTILTIKGRHDPCIVPRAAAVVESALAIALVNADGF